MSWLTDPDRAWLGVAALIAMVAARRIIDACIPKDTHFRFMNRWLENNGHPRNEQEDDPDDPRT
jgi:hypothetical protein